MIEREAHGDLLLVRMAHGKASALDLEFCRALTALFGELAGSDARGVVLTGRGRIFSAGVDLVRLLDEGPAYAAEFVPALCEALEAAFAFPKPLVCAINGHAIAGGCVIAQTGDRRIMAAGAGRVGIPELKVGVPFPASALEIMRFATSPERFQSVMYNGATYEGEDAQRRGLVDAIVDPGQLIDESLAALEKLGRLPGDAFSMTKAQVRAPYLERIRAARDTVDVQVSAYWQRESTLADIRDYVERTFKKSAS